MIRYDEVPNVWVRYDGTETLVFIARAHEGGGLTREELAELIKTLQAAQRSRKAFDKKCPGWDSNGGDV